MNYLKLIKGATDLVVSIGAGAVVTNMVKATTPDDVKRLNGIAIKIGTVVISSMVGTAASSYASKSIDDAVDGIKQVKEEAQDLANAED